MDGLNALSERSQNRRRGSRLPPGTRATSRCPRLRQAFEPRRTVHTITEEIPILDSMSPKLTPVELDAIVRRHLRVPFGHLSLQRAGSACGV
jgi:hypothetical protein